MDAEQFWQSVIAAMRPQPTVANPRFVSAQLVEMYPLPGWLKSSYDMPRHGYYIGLDTPEARTIQVERLRAALEPYLGD